MSKQALFSPLTDQLINALRCLPGVGAKTAQRMAFHLLERSRDSGKHLASSLMEALTHIKHCKRCRTFCETELCVICSNPHREQRQLCIVETPVDALAIEQTSHFRGYYFVLMGHLSPLDGIGPDELGLSELKTHVERSEVSEIIIATNPTVEGEATAHFIASLFKHHPIKITRLAHGVPLGGSLEFLDSGTLLRALHGRTVVES